MIKKKPSEAFDFVLLHDPAILPAGEPAINKYSMDRDLSKLDVDPVKGIFRPTGEAVTIIRAVPLRSDSFALKEMGVAAFRQIVKTHVVKVINLEGVTVTVNKDGATEIPDSSMDCIDADTLEEIAAVVIERGSGRDGIDRAFFSAATSRPLRIRSQQLPANAARLDRVRDMMNHIDSETAQASSTASE
jgi:hypothetical protein